MIPHLELFCEVCRPLAPDSGCHLLALLLGGVGEDGGALLVVRFVLVEVLLADVLVPLVHRLRVTEDPEAGREGEKKWGSRDDFTCAKPGSCLLF